MHLSITKEEDTTRLLRFSAYDAIIIDATVVENILSLIATIRHQQSTAKIIVAATSPTWTWAREIFLAGATDYIKKTLDKEELLASIRSALNKTLPPRS